MSIFKEKKLLIILHIGAWIIVFLLPIFLTSIERRQDFNFIGRIILRSTIYAIIFYISYLWLIPKLLFRGKKWNFYLIMVALILGLYVVNDTISSNFFTNREFAERNRQNKNAVTNQVPPPPQPLNKSGDSLRQSFNPPKPNFKKSPRWRFDIYNYMFTSILIAGFSLGLRMSVKYNENEKKRKELEKEKLSSELALLKNQVSPHFFFNTLNNIYSLIEINTKEAQNAVLHLSKLMRYLLYESEKGDTKLSSEIAFMKNYIDLMKLRISDKVKLSYTFPEEYKDFPFPPLIYIPFVENAFKHGVSYREKSFIEINFTISGNELIFLCRNSVAAKKEENTESGIGLENARKRLRLIFPETHLLEISQNNQVFEVSLKIQIKENV